MKKIISILLIGILSITILTSCNNNSGNNGDSNSESTNQKETKENDKEADNNKDQKLTKLTVAASPSPHGEILEAAREELAKEGFELEIIEYTDYILPNNVVDQGEIDANYFQHGPYLDDFNKENGTDLVAVAEIHYEPFGLYEGKSKSIEELQDGASIAVPNDTTNEARALILLEDQGLIKLKEGAGFAATKNDIASNPKNINIVELEAAQLPRTLPDVDLAVINGNYAIDAGLKVADAIATEDKESVSAETYANIIAVKRENEEKDSTKALIKALQSDHVRQFIESTYSGAVVPIF